MRADHAPRKCVCQQRGRAASPEISPASNAALLAGALPGRTTAADYWLTHFRGAARRPITGRRISGARNTPLGVSSTPVLPTSTAHRFFSARRPTPNGTAGIPIHRVRVYPPRLKQLKRMGLLAPIEKIPRERRWQLNGLIEALSHTHGARRRLDPSTATYQ